MWINEHFFSLVKQDLESGSHLECFFLLAPRMVLGFLNCLNSRHVTNEASWFLVGRVYKLRGRWNLKKKKKMVNCWPAGLLGPSSWVLLLLEALKWLCWLKICLCFYYFSKLLGNFRAKADMTCSPDGTFWALFNKVRADTDLFVLPSHFPLLDMTYHDHGDVFLSIFFKFFFPHFAACFLAVFLFDLSPSPPPGLCDPCDYH